MRRILSSIMTVQRRLEVGAVRFAGFSPYLSGEGEGEDGDMFQSRGPRGDWPRRNRRDSMDSFVEEISAKTKRRGKQEFAPLKNNIYVESEKTKGRNKEAVKEIRDKGQIIVSSDAPKPIKHFDELQFSDDVITHLNSEYQMPTPIQSQSWPAILTGRDIIGISETGSGKTLGFMLPLLAHIQKRDISKRDTVSHGNTVSPTGLIIAPVRELARQISEVAQEYERWFGVKSGLFYGGSGKDMQMRYFQQGFQLCIGTPGRLMDFAHQGLLDLEQVSVVVLDEADTMLSMGFFKQINSLVQRTREDRQTLLWTATWPSEVRELARDVTSKAMKIDIGSEDLRTKESITQEIIVVGGRLDYAVLGKLFDRIMEDKNCKTLLFTNTKARADRLTYIMKKNNLKVDCIHSDKSQSAREQSLDRFRKGYTDFLVATDVASRGLDIKGIQNIVNVDFPQNIVSYIHRIGRTARGQKKGKAYSIFSPANIELAGQLVKLLKETKQEINPELLKMSRSQRF